MSFLGASRRGFSLAEVMIALVVISIGLFALLALQIYSLKLQGSVSDTQRASALAASIADESILGLEEDFEAELGKERGPSAQPGLEYEVTVEQDPDLKLLKHLDVVIYWKDKDGNQKSYQLSTEVVKK